MSFEYPYTCPEIDSNISKIRAELESSIDDVLSDACGLLDSTTRHRLAREYAETFYNAIEDHIEAIRATNERMRRKAERQVEDLEEQVSDLQSELTHLQEIAE